ncbi:hypothetical protein HCH_04048 [Hahella chejuensis KCTC 2396]|uniref:Uncharacterized protein n=1 Tax=Hahella chejuensis (strain KCTC 2396) TaxID=349521 RepID=Q2SF11_HAHCH|nr:hypothetical protein HCH_04048 [Hahella chejuensis KCTC 2396]
MQRYTVFVSASAYRYASATHLSIEKEARRSI